MFMPIYIYIYIYIYIHTYIYKHVYQNINHPYPPLGEGVSCSHVVINNDTFKSSLILSNSAFKFEFIDFSFVTSITSCFNFSRAAASSTPPASSEQLASRVAAWCSTNSMRNCVISCSYFSRASFANCCH